MQRPRTEEGRKVDPKINELGAAKPSSMKKKIVLLQLSKDGIPTGIKVCIRTIKLQVYESAEAGSKSMLQDRVQREDE
jgi:hypothetical protein